MFDYINYFNELIKSGSAFWFCALLGTGMFFIQFFINIFGRADHEGLDADDLTDVDTGDSHDPADARKFKWLSMQAITGFLMMFGWTGITAQLEFGLTIIPTLGISLAAGVFSAFMIRAIFKLAKKLQSPGTAYRIEDAIGKEGYVYQAIPKNGVGKVSLSMQNFTHEIHAVSHDSEELASFTRVKIIEIKDKHTVVVTLI